MGDMEAFVLGEGPASPAWFQPLFNEILFSPEEKRGRMRKRNKVLDRESNHKVDKAVQFVVAVVSH